jgi:hypothetical protein
MFEDARLRNLPTPRQVKFRVDRVLEAASHPFMATESEKRFEEYCRLRNYRFTRIELPVTAGRRPDYRLHLCAGDVLCEIKQIEAGPWEENIEKLLKQHGKAEASRTIGTRARGLIMDAAPQLRNFKSEKIPALIFAMDLTWHDHLSEVDLDAAMFGQPLMKFFLDENSEADPRSAFGHGKGRQMTEDSRLYISAVCVLDRRELRLNIYHNPFATQQLYPWYFPHSDDRHFVKDGHPEAAGHHWCEYVGPRAPEPSKEQA